MIYYLKAYWYILTKYRDYKPQKIKLSLLKIWLSQFPASIRRHVLALLLRVKYISEKETRESLVSLNKNILDMLSADGISTDKIIYVQIDKAGSSSPVILNMLRDDANLERRGCKFVDSKDVERINQFTNELKSGAIIYVDDFAGSGKQFTRNRKWTADYIIGSFSEFFIAPCMCEEAIERIQETSVDTHATFIHSKNQRPLHSDCNTLDPNIKNEFINLCNQIHPQAGLGFDGMATMVVLYRNAPNTMPLIFRGSLRQRSFKGIFPRFDDLPY